MPFSIALPPDLEAAARAQADRAHSGDLSALAAAALVFYLGLTEQQRLISERHAADTPAATDEVLAGALAAQRIPVETLQTIITMLSRSAGLMAARAPDGSVPPPADAVIKDCLSWVAASPADHSIGCVLVSTQPASGTAGTQREAITTFAHGQLRAQGTGISGDLAQVFSDRSFDDIPSRTAGNPFSPRQSEQLGVNIAMDRTTGLVTLELVAHAWHDARQRLRNLRIVDGVVLADGDGVGNQVPTALYALSFAMLGKGPASAQPTRKKWYARILPATWRRDSIGR